MKNVLNLTLKRLAIALLFFLPSFCFGQGTEYFKCPGFVPTPPINEFPPNAPCDINPEHPNFNNEEQIWIGVGTPFERSSQLGNSISDNVRIVGNFIVDDPFTFLDAVVMINPNVQITVEPSFFPFDPDGGLIIDNSDLFSCAGLWTGIVMQPTSIVNTRNNSSIQDAMIAIRAEPSGILFIQNTTFNRNWVGISLTGNAVSAPNVGTFSGNTFSCTAPIKGTQLQTLAGVALQNAILTTFGATSLNRFRDLNYGIVAVGELCNLSGRNLRFDRILHDGISMTHGVIHLTAPTTFVNCHENGINIEAARVVNITGAVVLLNPSIPEDLDIHRTGIRIEQFDLNSSVIINHLNFSANMDGTENMVRGIHLIGGNVGAGTTIHISDNSIFSLKAMFSQGIFLEGVFPESSTTEIFLNHFRVSSVTGDTGGASPHGIEASGGSKNNLSIMWNTFSGFLNSPNDNQAQCVYLRSSSGINNEVSINSFNDGAGYCANYIEVHGFQNTIYCSNIFSSFGGDAFAFFGTNMGTIIRANTITGCSDGIMLFGGTSFIGEQINEGNRFFDLFFGGWQVGPLFHASCASDPVVNAFTVHTTQRVCGNPADPACLFNPFFPERIAPNDAINGFFFITDPDSIPNPGCDGQFNEPGGTDELDRRIAQGLIPAPSEEPALIWVLERYLYQKFKNNLELLSEHNAFPAFLSNKANCSVGKFYEVQNSVEAALMPSPSVDAASKLALTNMGLLIQSLVALDEQIEAVGNGAGLEALLQAKQSKTDQLRSLQISYNSLSTTYKSQVAANLQAAYTLNEGVATAHGYEANEKTVNQIHLISMMQQGGKLTEDQVLALQAIAEQDPKQGGPAVHTAMGMLPECAKPETEPAPRGMPRGLENQVGHYKLISSTIADKILVSPNPASSSFRVSKLPGNSGNLSLTDMTGRLVLSKPISSPEATIEVTSSLPSGIYLLRIMMDDGTSLVQKLALQPK